MRVTSAAISYISLPSSKGDPFRGGPSPKKEKRRSRSIARVLSAPIRRMGRQLSKRSNRKNPKKIEQQHSPEYLQTSDEEQGWIAPATTFETEDTLSPRSFDSLTTSNSDSILVQTNENKHEEVIFNCPIVSESHRIQSDDFLDLEAAVNESAKPNMIYQRENDAQDIINDILRKDSSQVNHEQENAAPQRSDDTTSDLKDIREIGNVFDNRIIHHDSVIRDENSITGDGLVCIEPEDKREIVESVLPTMAVEEVDSLAPATDISFFLEEEEEEDDDFHCVGRISKNHEEVMPFEIDIDRESVGIISENSITENKSQELYIEDDDAFSSTSSYNSYLQAIENVTASANSGIEQAITMTIDKIDLKKPSDGVNKLDLEQELQSLMKVEKYELDQESVLEEEDDYFCVSFNPSRELLLQAMEGASAKAKSDIEQATALALSKIDSANSSSAAEGAFNKVPTSKYVPNRVLGFFFFLFFLLNFNQNSLKHFRGLRSNSHSAGIIDFEIPQRYAVDLEPESYVSIWGENQAVSRPLEREQQHNVACVFKIGCLALGNL